MGLLNLGFGQATIKYVAESIGRGDTEEASSYVCTTLLFNLGAGLLGMILIVLSANLLSTKVFKIAVADQQLAQVAFYWVAAGWLVSQVSATYIGVPTALQKYSIVAIGTSLSTSVGIVAGLLAVALGGNLLTLLQARFAWNIVVVVFWAWIAARLLPGALRPRWHKAAFHRSFNFGIWQTLGNLGGLFANQTDRFVLGAYLSTTAVGLYNIALTMQQTLYTVVYKLGEVLFPAISNLQGSGEDQRPVRLMLRSGWFLGVLTIAVLGPVVVFSHDLLRLYVGANIANSVTWLLQVLAVAGMLSSGSVSVGQYMLGTGKTQWIAITAFASGLVILIGGLLLVPRLGLMGAGWTQILAIVLSRPIIHMFLWRSYLRQEVPAKVFCSHLYGPAVMGVAGALSLALVRIQLMWQLGWFELGVGWFVCALVLLVGVLVVDSFLPAGTERGRDVRRLVALILAQFQAIARRGKAVAKPAGEV